MYKIFVLLSLAFSFPALAQVSIENGTLKSSLPLIYDVSSTSYNVYGYTSTPTSGQHGLYNTGTVSLDASTPATGSTPRCDLEITLEDPIASEDVTIGWTTAAITITEMEAVVIGTTPSVTWTVKHGIDRSAAGAAVVTAGTTTTSESGQNITTMNDPTVVANSFVWLETSAQTGTVTELFVTACYTLD